MRLIVAATILALGLVVSALIDAHQPTAIDGPGHRVEDPIVVTVDDPDDVYFHPFP